jgi:DNA-binding NarL/FixJ family response regulator
LILIRVLIADDHDVVRGGVRSILLSRSDVEVCGEASDGKEAVDKALAHKPDIIVLDITMPAMGGFAAATELRRRLPDIPILFYSIHDGAYFVAEAKRLGVQGFVSKSRISETLLEAIDAVVIRKTTFFPSPT